MTQKKGDFFEKTKHKKYFDCTILLMLLTSIVLFCGRFLIFSGTELQQSFENRIHPVQFE